MKIRIYPFFLAQRLAARQSAASRATSSLLRFTILGIALSLAVMLLTIFVGKGFRNQVHERIYLLTGHIILNEYGRNYADESASLRITPDLLSELAGIEGIGEIRQVVQSGGIIKTDSDFSAVLVMGVSSRDAYLHTSGVLRDGYIPYFDGSDTLHNPILLPLECAEKLHLTVGDKVPIYFTGARTTVRTFTIAGIVDLPHIEAPIVVAPIGVMRHVAHIDEDKVTRLELFVQPKVDHLALSDRLVEQLSKSPNTGGQSLGMYTAESLMPDIFAWIEMLDANISLLLVLMLIVASFTLITGLLILILDRTRMIGLLKALGARYSSIRSLFLYLAAFVVGKGLLWGNLIAFALAGVQYIFSPIQLDPATYYLSYVPIEFDIPWVLGINLLVFVLSMISLLLPTRIIARIRAVDTLRFNQ